MFVHTEVCRVQKKGNHFLTGLRRMYCKVIRTFRRSRLNLFVKRRLNAKNNTPLNIRFEISSSWTRIFSSQCLHWNAHRSIKRILSIRSNRLAACLNDIEAWPDRIESDLIPFQHKKWFFRVVKPYVSQKKYYLSETFLVISKIKRWALKTVKLAHELQMICVMPARTSRIPDCERENTFLFPFHFQAEESHLSPLWIIVWIRQHPKKHKPICQMNNSPVFNLTRFCKFACSASIFSLGENKGLRIHLFES